MFTSHVTHYPVYSSAAPEHCSTHCPVSIVASAIFAGLATLCVLGVSFGAASLVVPTLAFTLASIACLSDRRWPTRAWNRSVVWVSTSAHHAYHGCRQLSFRSFPAHHHHAHHRGFHRH